MAISKQKASGNPQVSGNPQTSGGPHWAVGINVILMVVLAVALVAGLQWIAYSYSTRADLTSSGVNSLTPATRNLLDNLSTKVTLTSLYFKTDLEDEDQDRYRSTVDDLLELYRAENRSQISADSINPLKDRDRLKTLYKHLATLTKFKDETSGYVAAVETFRSDMLPRITSLLSEELSQLDAFGPLDGKAAQLVVQVKELYDGLQTDIGQASTDIADALASDVPAHGAAVGGIRQTYATVAGTLKSIQAVGSQLTSAPGQLPQAVEGYFIESTQRYADLLSALKAEQAKLDDLPPLKIDEIFRALRSETSNPVLVATEEDARIVAFRDIWAQKDPRLPARRFNDHKFLGEQKLTSAILQLTQKKKPAVVFVRFGGSPLLKGGYMPGQPPAPYARMKTQLEDANFSVHEWDLATQNAMPEIDPPPSRTIFVVLRPTAPQRNPFGQQPQQPTFSPENLDTLKKAMGDNPRALFLAGWSPGMGPMAAPYDYADYLRTTWGIEADCDRLLFQVEPVGPEKFQIMRPPLQLDEARFSDHPVVSGLGQRRAVFPLVAPIAPADTLPNGVQVERLAWFPQQDGLWSISDISYYSKQQANEYIVRDPGDVPGEFDLSLAATRGDGNGSGSDGDRANGKVVVISSSGFSTDSFALATEMAVASQGLTFRPRNPGNVAFFVNALHWLNDNAEWMNLGTPVDNATIAIAKDSPAMTFVRVLVLGIWPGLAACCGFVVWMARRR